MNLRSNATWYGRLVRHALFALVISVAFDAAAQHIAWRTYGLREGLTNLSIRALQQGRDGELWVGTDNGLFHFDGQRFTPVEAPGTSEVYALALSPDGELWAMSANGAVVRQTAAERFEPVDIGSYERLVRPPGLAFTTQGEVYLLQSAGLVRGTRTNGRWHFELVVRDAITALAVVGDRVRFASGSLLKEYSPAAGVRSLTESAGLPLEPWKCLGHDPEGHLWVRGAARLFDVAPDAKGSVDRSAEVSTSSKTCTLSFDRQHHVYVPSDEGLSMVGPTRTLRFDPAHGFPASTVITSLVDSDGALWVGSFGLGLVRPLGSGAWLGWQHADGLSHNSVWAILPTSSGTTWVGTTRGLNVIDAEMRIVRSIGVAEGLPGAWVGALIETNEHEIIAATSPAALTRLGLDGTVLGRTEAASGLFGDRLDALAIDREGRLWVGHRCWRSREPVARGRPLSFDLVTVPGLPADQTFRHVLVDRRGVVWLSGSAGLSRFDGAAWQHLTEADGLASGNVAAVSEDETGLWVSYREPLGLTHLVDGPTRGLTPLALPKRLAAYATATDATGRLWVSTDNGVWVRENGAWQHFDTEDGLVWDDGNDLALATDARGRVWVGTSNGLACLTANTARAPLPIARVISAEGDDGPLDVRHSLVLPWSRRGLRLRFGTVNLLAETRTRFRYRLAGYEEAWHETTDRSLQYLDLPPGTYRFELLAGAPGGVERHASPCRLSRRAALVANVVGHGARGGPGRGGAARRRSAPPAAHRSPKARTGGARHRAHRRSPRGDAREERLSREHEP